MRRRKLGPKIVSINYQHSHLVRLKDEADASKLEEARAKNREYQCSHLARPKAEVDASKLRKPGQKIVSINVVIGLVQRPRLLHPN
jgi:hypothetical protein